MPYGPNGMCETRTKRRRQDCSHWQRGQDRAALAHGPRHGPGAAASVRRPGCRRGPQCRQQDRPGDAAGKGVAVGDSNGPRDRAPLRHKEAITAAALSANGKIAVTGSYDKTARAWETATGKPIGAPVGHQNLVFAVALSDDGSVTMTMTADRTFRLWDTATGKPLGPLPPHKNAGVNAIALSGDGKIALTGGAAAQRWDVATGQPIGPALALADQRILAVALSADGQVALAGGDSIKLGLTHNAQLWDAAVAPIGANLPHQGGVDAAALSADGRIALTRSQDKTARLWDAATGKPIGPPLRLPEGVLRIALNADGRTALTSSFGGTAQLWEAATGKGLGPPLQHQGAIYGLALSADGRTVLTGSNDGTARLWKNAVRVADQPDRVALGAHVITGLEIDGLEDPLRPRCRQLAAVPATLA